jgi:hypothetical protein
LLQQDLRCSEVHTCHCAFAPLPPPLRPHHNHHEPTINNFWTNKIIFNPLQINLPPYLHVANLNSSNIQVAQVSEVAAHKWSQHWVKDIYIVTKYMLLLWELSFSQQCWWKFKTPGIWHHVSVVSHPRRTDLHT